jgi:hypothetical protein
MENRYDEVMKELINNLQDAEHRFCLALHEEDLEDAFCEGLRESLGVLKEEHFENTEFYKKLEERESSCAIRSDKRRDYIYMNNGNEVSSLWDEFQELAEKLSNEDPRHVQAKRIKFNTELETLGSDSEANEEVE